MVSLRLASMERRELELIPLFSLVEAMLIEITER
jgi:hypothetical protein